MASNVREILNEFVGGLGQFATTNGEQVSAFMAFQGASYDPKVVDLKTKELISVAIGCYNRCKYCIVYHSYKAFESGASKEEILDAAMVAVAMGGAPSMAYSVTLLQECVAEFQNDFK